jgi:hypothetical protein
LGRGEIKVALVDRTVAALRFFGDDLDPDELTDLLDGQPTFGIKKGGTWLTKGGNEIIASNGSWRLSVASRSNGDLDGQIVELLSALSHDLVVWRNLAVRFKADIFCGLFLKCGNEGFDLQPATLSMIGERGLTLSLDIYRL